MGQGLVLSSPRSDLLLGVGLLPDAFLLECLTLTKACRPKQRMPPRDEACVEV